MTTPSRILRTVCLVLVAFFNVATISASAATGADKAEIESFRGYLATPAYRMPRLISSAVTLRIDCFSSDDETEQISALLGKGKPNAAQSLLGERRVGTLQIGDALPEPVAGAWSFSDELGRHIVVLAARPISMREIFGNRRSSDYPYTVAQIDVEEDGHGSGELSLAARLKVDETGHLEYNPLSVIPLRILGVRRLVG